MFVPDSEFPSCRNVNLSEEIQVKGATRFYVEDFLEFALTSLLKWIQETKVGLYG